MKVKAFFSTARNVSVIGTVITFLALIRCIAEPFRLRSVSVDPPAYDEIVPFLVGALTAALCLLAITIAHYYARYRLVIAMCILNILLLLVVKWHYALP